MPRQNKFKKGYVIHSDEHDYRGGGDTRKVSFKTIKNRGKPDRNKDWGASLRSHLEEDDVDMGTNSNISSRNILKKHPKKKPFGVTTTVLHKGFKKTLLESLWYRITIPYGNKYDKSYILQTLQKEVEPLQFFPICWTVQGHTATFYLDDYKVASRLHTLNRSIQYPDGFKMIIRVNCGSPNVIVDDELKERIKLTMAKRYNALTKALDMTKFHNDPDLQDVFCALYKPQILSAVVDIIAKNIPEIEAINFNNNHIQILSFLKDSVKQLPHLKILHMGNNKLHDIAKLDPLIGLPIIDLVLDGNPLCDKYRDQDKYISEVRKIFPKVMKLDGIELPPPIKFDIAEETALPSFQQTFLCNQDAQGVVRQFLEQYFTIFDSDNRQPLLQAYHEHALFSMTMAYPYGQHNKNSPWLNWYATDNRNLDRVRDVERRHKLLKQGQLSVVSFLSDMPSSKHDLHNFRVDLTVFTPQMLTLTVSGLFKELRSTGHKVPPLRCFFRTLIIVPAGAGFCITNEELHITNATEEQAKLAFKIPTSVPVQPPTTITELIPSVSQAHVPDDQTKQQMIQAMAQHSGMNLEFSQKCLEETNWDYQRAGFVFTELQKQGIIPPEAFVK